MNNIDITIINNYKSNFESEKKMFDVSSYYTFSNSYLRNCDNTFIKQVSNNIDNVYKKIQSDYNNIYKWWNEYIENVTALEKNLSDNQGLGYISESVIRNYVQRNLKDILIKQVNISNINVVNNKESDFEEYII